MKNKTKFLSFLAVLFFSQVHAQVGVLFALPQFRCEHPQGTLQTLETRGFQQLQKAAKAHSLGRRA